MQHDTQITGTDVKPDWAALDAFGSGDFDASDWWQEATDPLNERGECCYAYFEGTEVVSYGADPYDPGLHYQELSLTGVRVAGVGYEVWLSRADLISDGCDVTCIEDEATTEKAGW